MSAPLKTTPVSLIRTLATITITGPSAMESSSDETEYNHQNDLSEAKSGYSSPSSSQDSQYDDFVVPPDAHEAPYLGQGHFIEQEHALNHNNSHALKRRYSSQSTSSSTQDDDEPPHKQMTGKKTMTIMGRMSYEPEQGLSKMSHVRLEAAQAAVMQDGRRGFGQKSDGGSGAGIDTAPKKWSPESKRRYSSQSTSSSTTQDEENYEQSQKPIAGNYSNKAMQIMSRMGYNPEKGLGKMGQGRLEPVQASTQDGRRGFGLKLDGIDAAALKWTPDMEQIIIPEIMDWLKNEDADLYDITMQDLAEWVVIGHKKETIDDETRFCNPDILRNVLNSKSIFDNLSDDNMRKARTRSNPFETIRGGIFLNRAAMKMANMDSLCDFMFTNPIDENGQSLVKDNDLLYFADICAGPGGFSEYVLFRKGWEAKGFGFTLKGDHDFKLNDFLAGPPETFDPNYGIKDDGNIFDPENIESFTEYVLRQSEIGVHLVMADGGFSVEGQENIQEILSKQLYLCQCLVALSILREKGHFVVKLFDLFTPFSVGLVYLMYKCFEEICICKPNTSRPANSERYLICKWKRGHTDTIRRHLFHINEEMWSNKGNNIDTIELVKHEILARDERFCDYITNSNNRIGENQIIGLLKIAAYCNDPDLKETRQPEYKKTCLELWRVPDRMRSIPEKQSTEKLLSELLGTWDDDSKFLDIEPKELSSVTDLKKRFGTIYNWSFVPVDREDSRHVRAMFLCKGGRDIHIYTHSKTWRKYQDVVLEISPKSLFYAEIVMEMDGEAKSQRRVAALHIIDGIVLGGKDIRRLSLQERLRMCDKFARALNKPHVSKSEGPQPVAPIRAKKLFPLIELRSFFDQMKLYRLKDNTERLGFRIRIDDNRTERFFVPGGLMFFNGIYTHFTMHLSKTSNQYYYCNTNTRRTFYSEQIQNLGELYASFRSSYYYRLIWKWVDVRQVEEYLDDAEKTGGILYRTDFYQYLQEAVMT